MVTTRPPFKTVQDLLTYSQRMGHRVQIAPPLHPGERSEATCPVCQGRLILLAEDQDIEATVAPDLLEPCAPRPLVTLVLEATFQPGD